MSTNVIQTNHLFKSYGDLEAVKDLSIEIPEGKIFGFLGPNGAGKTTSLNMIVGLLRPTKGKITIYDKDPVKFRKEITRSLGLIPQDLVYWENLTVRENLLFASSLYNIPNNIAEQRVDTLISKIHLTDKRNELAKNLSGGLKRRLNIILGLVHDPKIVVCDEPTPGLDPQSRALVWEFIHDLSRKEGKTIILTTHFMDEADRLSDIVAIIDHGELLVVDTPEKLKNSIGEGDLVEIHINKEELLEMAFSKIKELDIIGNTRLIGDTIQIQCLNAPSKMARIFNSIEIIPDLEVTDMKIRKASLEDVFIHLTGRELRD